MTLGVALLAGLALFAVFALLAGVLEDTPATIHTTGGVELRCPGVIEEGPDGFRCGDLTVPIARVKNIPHFGPRAWWW